MKAVCLVVQNYYDGDARVRRKAEALVAEGHSVDVLALRPAGGKKFYVLNGVNVYTLSLGKLRGSLARYGFEYAVFFVWAFVRISCLMTRRRYGVIDANTLPDFLIFAGLIARWMGARLVLDMHEITPEFFISKYGFKENSWVVRLLKMQEKWSFDFADHVITINEPIQQLLESRGLPRAKSTIIMNSADERRFDGKSAAPAGPAQGTFAMIYHGTLTKIYGLDIAIEAFDLARELMPGAELWILGSGTEQEHLADLAARRGLFDRVKLIGQVRSGDIPGWLARCSAGLLPIRQDVFLDFAFPNKLGEFIVAGKPVIVSRLRTISYYFSDHALAYFEPNSAADLARQMVRMYRDTALRDRLSRCAREEYSPIRWDVMKDRYLTLVHRLSEGILERQETADPRLIA